MKKYLLFILALILLITSCSYFSPAAKQTRAEDKVNKAKEAIFTSEEEIVKESKGYVYAADYSLSLNPNPNQYTIVAKQMTTRALGGLGQPDIADMVKMTAIVEGLVSSNKAIVAKAEIMLREKDADIVELQAKVTKYENVLKDKEKQFLDLSRENAKLANTWVTIKSYFRYLIYIFIGMIILRIGSAILPPPWNSIGFIIDYVFGGIARLIFSILPKAKDTAKVVSADVQVALNQVVTSIQDTKEKIAAKNEASATKSVGLEALKSELNKNTDTTTKNIITDTKRVLGYN